MSIEINIRGRRAGSVASPGNSGQLQYGVYDVWADGGDLFIGVGTLDATAAVSPALGQNGPLDLRTLTEANGYKIAAGNVVSVRIAQNGDVIGFVGVGTAYWHKVD